MADSYPGGFSATCIEADTIAAFVDGTIEQAGRARVLAHLAGCADCSELVAEVMATQNELRGIPAPLAPAAPRGDDERRGKVLPMRRRGLALAGGFAAIAATLLLFVLNRGSELDALVTVVGSERLTLARPTGGFHYGTLRSPVRGSADGRNYALEAEVARLRERAERTNRPRDLHASGVAALASGDTAGAIASLERAAGLAPEDAEIAADLGAALLSRFVERGEPADSAAALASIDRALALSPSLAEAWFNKALLFERVSRPDDALNAWTKYLELADDRAWRDEATRSRDALRRQLGR